MEIIIQVITYLATGWLIIVPFLLYRNAWVFEKRVYVIDNQHQKEFNRLPDYDTMLWKFWVWDVEKFKRKIN